MLSRKNKYYLVTGIGVLLAGLLSFTLISARPSAVAESDCQTFKETGKTVCGKFLQYWKTHGGLEQQGFPISDVIEEQNAPPPAGDGKVHKVQYFQRARFEEHLENAGTQYEVLLGLLGAEQWQSKQGQAPQPAPSPQPTANPQPTAAPAPSTLTVRSKEFRNIIGKYTKPKDGFRFLILDVMFVNTSKEEVSTCNLYFSVTTNASYTYKSNLSDYELEQRMACEKLPAGQQRAGKLAFEIPNNEVGIKLNYDHWSDLKAETPIP